jgi:polysaccharide chain length determinant protein (PEP-CTERM system associated)
MDPTNIKELLNALLIELLRYRKAVLIVFILISSAVLSAGYLIPKLYTSNVVLHADVSNIIGSLLEGKASITKIDRAKEARDIIYTDRILRATAADAGFTDPDASIASLRSKLKISASGDYVRIKYQSRSADESFNVLDAVSKNFIAETARKKREESQGAFDFIDAQVKSYKAQLEAAEQELKAFTSQNIGISENSVSSKVNKYKDDIQILNLEIQDGEARLASYQLQLAQEPEFLKVENQQESTFEENQLQAYELQLSQLRLTYLDTHPDIISLKEQIIELKDRIAKQKAENSGRSAFTEVENPSYTSLKEIINREQADIMAKRRRLANTNALLDAEYSNAETVAAKQATLQELTRDYSVNKGVYEDMLKSREQARLSMTLDIQGQGATYKLHEPATYPVRSDGFQLIHFALVGPVVGLLAPIGLLVLLVIMDQRVRSTTYMVDNLPSHIDFLTTIPMYDSAISELSSKRELIVIGFIALLYLLVYAVFSKGAAALSLLGLV